MGERLGTKARTGEIGDAKSRIASELKQMVRASRIPGTQEQPPPEELPSLKTTFWLMGIFGFLTLWCFGGIFQSAVSDPGDVPYALAATITFGVGFLVIAYRHLNVVKQRQRWRDRRYIDWIKSDIAELPVTDWEEFEREIEHRLRNNRGSLWLSPKMILRRQEDDRRKREAAAAGEALRQFLRASRRRDR